MKELCVISDIHSNIEALIASVNEIKYMYGPVKIISLGDIVGYGPSPSECIHFIRCNNIESIAGNHDYAAAEVIGISDFNINSRKSADWTRKSLSVGELEYLKGLPEKKVEDCLFFVHGSLHSPLHEYLIVDAAIERNFSLMSEGKICFAGHTHKPVIIKKDNTSGTIDTLVPEYNKKISIPVNDCSYIVNPGSIGQPRDGDPRSSFLYANFDENYLVYTRMEYSVRLTQKKMAANCLPEFLIERIARGV